jgi:hypothetical protein
MRSPTRFVSKQLPSSRIFTLSICVLFIVAAFVTTNSTAQGLLSADNRKTATALSDSFAPAPTPILLGYGINCAKLNLNGPNYPQFTHIVSDYELKLNFTPPPGLSGPYPFTSEADPSYPRILNGIPDENNSVSIDHLTGNIFNWTSTRPISAVIVQADVKAFVYPYPQPTYASEGLTTPDKGTLGITSISFCYYTPATVTIIKEVETFSGGNASTQAFPFSATNFTPANFALVDNNSQPADRITNSQIYSFGAANAVTVTELPVPVWSLGDLDCAETAGGGGNGFPNLPNIQNSSISFADAKATIVLEEGENVTCTFRNVQAQPTAASASVSGRVLTETGLPLSRAAVTIFNANTLQSQTVYTNPLGFYRFDYLPVNNFYILSVAHGKRSFINNSLSFNLDDNLSEINFYAQY